MLPAGNANAWPTFRIPTESLTSLGWEKVADLQRFAPNETMRVDPPGNFSGQRNGLVGHRLVVHRPKPLRGCTRRAYAVAHGTGILIY